MKTFRCLILAAVCCLTIGLEASAQKIKRPDSYNYQRGYEALQNEDYGEALEYFGKDLQENPKSGYPNLFIGMIHAGYDEFGQALTAIDNAIKYLPKKDKEYLCRAYLIRSYINLSLADTVKALDDYASAARINPEEYDIYKERADVYYEQGKYDLADADYRKMISLRSGDVAGYMGLGRNANALKHWDEAIKQFDYVTKLSSNYSSGYAFRAESYIGLEKWDEATDDIISSLNCEFDNKALYLATTLKEPALTMMVTKMKVQAAKSPYEGMWPFAIASVYEGKNDKKAIEYYTKANDIDASDVIYYMISKCYLNMGNYNMALNAIDQALNMDSTDVDYMVCRANILYEMGDEAAALAHWNKVIEENPDNAYCYYLRGVFKNHTGDNEGAVEDLSMAIVLNPKDAYSYISRARIYKDQGKTDLVEADCKKVIEIEDTPAKYNCISYAYLYLGENDKAIEACNSIIARDTTDAGSYYDAACVYSLMRNHDMAMEYLKKCFEHGYKNFSHIKRDNDMDYLRDTEDFKALIEQYQTKVETDDSVTAFGQRDNEVTTGDNDLITAASEVPFTKENGVCKVKCQINDLPLYFIFDTGASDVTLSMVEASFMMKNGFLADSDVVGSQRYMDANGNVTVGTVINLKKVEFGGMTLNNVRASVVQNQKAPLLLGQSVLGRLGKIEIDNQHQVLKIKH